MLPSQVRRRILDDHDHLRGALIGLERSAGDLRGGQREALAPTLSALRRLAQRFLDHLALEEEIMVPALRDADAWGPERAKLVLAEHEAQRIELAELLEALSTSNVTAEFVGQRLIAWIEALRIDMEHEETSVLHPDLLRDDVVSIAAESG